MIYPIFRIFSSACNNFRILDPVASELKSVLRQMHYDFEYSSLIYNN